MPPAGCRCSSDSTENFYMPPGAAIKRKKEKKRMEPVLSIIASLAINVMFRWRKRQCDLVDFILFFLMKYYTINIPLICCLDSIGLMGNYNKTMDHTPIPNHVFLDSINHVLSQKCWNNSFISNVPILRSIFIGT